MSFHLAVVLANASPLLGGLTLTCLSTLIALAIGLAGGPLIYLMRSSRIRPLAWIADGYLSVFRTTPEMVLIFWAYFCLPVAVGWQMSGLVAGSLTLGLVAAAYLSEILRAGLEAVPAGQYEAGRALGLPRLALWSRVVLPQALPIMSGPFVNYLTELIKNTTLLAAVGVGELAFVSYTLGSKTYRYFEFITAMGALYFVVIFPISMFALYLERRNPLTLRR